MALIPKQLVKKVMNGFFFLNNHQMYFYNHFLVLDYWNILMHGKVSVSMTALKQVLHAKRNQTLSQCPAKSSLSSAVYVNQKEWKFECIWMILWY